MKRNVYSRFRHDCFEECPLSSLGWALGFGRIALRAFKHARCHSGALIGQKAGCANCSAQRGTAFASQLAEVSLLVLKGVEDFGASMNVAPKAARAKIAYIVALGHAPGDNMIDALGRLLHAVGAMLPIHHDKLGPCNVIVVFGVSTFHSWQTFFKRTSPLAGRVGLPRSRNSKTAMQLRHRITPNVILAKKVYHKNTLDTNRLHL